MTQWETAQGFEPSEPQWAIGRNMELMLPQLEPYLFPTQNITTTDITKTQDNQHAATAKKIVVLRVNSVFINWNHSILKV